MALGHFFGGSGRRKGERGEALPLSDPETQPDSCDPSGPCPRCGRISNFQVLGNLPVSFEGGSVILHQDGRQEPRTLDRVSVLICAGCGQGTVVVEEQWVGEHPSRVGMLEGGPVTFRGVHWWPPPGAVDLGDEIPEDLRRAFADGMKCLSVRCAPAAAAMFRRTLETIVQDRGSDRAKAALEKNLARALNAMVQDGDLHPHLAEWSREVRLAGNAGAHFDLLGPVEITEAEELAKMTRELFNYLYEMPARIRRSRSTPP